MKKYQKTAKDKAWDREREKLNHEIFSLHQKNVDLINNINALTAAQTKIEKENEKLKEILEELTSQDTKVLLEKYESANKLEKLFRFLSQGGIY